MNVPGFEGLFGMDERGWTWLGRNSPFGVPVGGLL